MLLGSPGLFCMDQSLLLPRQAQWRLLFGLSCWRCWAAIYMHGKGATIDFICVISTVCSVCLNLSEVLMLLFACCSERVRDVLVAMWDRKTIYERHAQDGRKLVCCSNCAARSCSSSHEGRCNRTKGSCSCSCRTFYAAAATAAATAVTAAAAQQVTQPQQAPV
jgi:hypothetical protein